MFFGFSSLLFPSNIFPIVSITLEANASFPLSFFPSSVSFSSILLNISSSTLLYSSFSFLSQLVSIFSILLDTSLTSTPILFPSDCSCHALKWFYLICHYVSNFSFLCLLFLLFLFLFTSHVIFFLSAFSLTSFPFFRILTCVPFFIFLWYFLVHSPFFPLSFLFFLLLYS